MNSIVASKHIHNLKEEVFIFWCLHQCLLKESLDVPRVTQKILSLSQIAAAVHQEFWLCFTILLPWELPPCIWLGSFCISVKFFFHGPESKFPTKLMTCISNWPIVDFRSFRTYPLRLPRTNSILMQCI